MNKATPIIEFRDFSFHYRAQKKPTLTHINLSIHHGEKVLIVGPSGSGKSTLAHCINGLIPFNYPGESSGSLIVGGLETREASMFALSRIVGTVLQDPDSQFVGLTAGEDIAFSLENSCVPQPEMKQRVQESATMVNVADHLDKSPFDLSGGQKQRVSLAGVIVDRVQVLLFDEPLANLDPKTGKRAVELFDEVMQQTDATVIIIEHRLEDVLHSQVDRIVLMGDGQILADLPAGEMLSSDWLQKSGIREPLYLTALKYAGVPVVPDMRPEHMALLQLTEEQRTLVQQWFHKELPEKVKAEQKPLLQIQGLTFGYDPKQTVIEPMSFTINAGEMTAIVGTNGAGKSTLAKLICGFETQQEGSLYLAGQDLSQMSIAERASHIGYVMQNPNQMISKTMIFEEVAMGLVSRGMDEDTIRERVEKALHICGLYPFRNWPISALSFGQKKRVTIASVLVMEPEIIILDEPTAGQDFRHYTEIMEFLRQLNQQGITVLMITHDMHLMLEYAGRALVFSKGKLLADATAAEVLTNAELAEAASLRETSLFALAKRCDISDGTAFVQHFIDDDRERRTHDGA